MIRYCASWVLPIVERPIRDGWVAIDGGRVAAVGGTADRSPEMRDLGHVAILPGLVNAHAHLELSYLSDQVPTTDDFVSWIRRVVSMRRQHPDPKAPYVLDAIRKGIEHAVGCGTALVGDISNTLAPFESLVESPLAAVLFYELIRFKAQDAADFVTQVRRQTSALTASRRIHVSLAAHAPYSVSPEVFQAIRSAIHEASRPPCSVHLAESVAEVEFIRTGGGPWRSFLEDVGAWDSAWKPPGVSPVEYLDQCGFLTPRLLAVHGVQMTTSDLALLAARGSTLVTCPRSNERTGAGTPPIAAFYESGVRVAVGTDSLASTPDLNVFAELAELRRLAPAVPAATLLDSATRQGAVALGFGGDYGTIESGKSARLIAVAIPNAVDDVEEYLVSGIRPEQIQWLDAGPS